MSYRETTIAVSDGKQCKTITLLVPADSRETAEAKIRDAISSFVKTRVCRLLMEEDERTPDTFTWDDVITYMPSSAWAKHHIIIKNIVDDGIIVPAKELINNKETM